MKLTDTKALLLAVLLALPHAPLPVQAQAEPPEITEPAVVPGVLPAPLAVAPVIPSLADERNRAALETPVLSFAEAIAVTLKNNPQRAAARAALQAAQARVGTARAAGGLQVGLSGDATYDKNFGGGSATVSPTPGGGNGGFNNRNNAGFNQSLGVNADLPIYNGGRVRAGTRAAQAAARVQAAQTLQVEQDLVLNAATAYLGIIRNEQLLEVAQSNLAVSRERLRVAQVRFDAGAAARLDVLRAATTLADAEQRRVVAGNDVAQVKATLNTLMGRAPETPLRVLDISTLPVVATPPDPTLGDATPADPAPGDATPPGGAGENQYPTIADKSSAELRAIAEASSRELAAAREQVRVAEANVDVAKAQRKPSLGLSVSGFLSNPASFLGRFAASLGLGIAQTLFDSGRARSQISEARSLLEQARQNLQGQRLTVGNDIEQLLLEVDAAQRRLDTTDVAVVSAREAVRAAQLGYEAGALTSVDVSDAQSAFIAAQTEAVNARFDLALSRARLAAAAGVLTPAWQAAYEVALRDELARLRQGKR
ncbi:MAG TPA: TolC family protein [Abditibacteriaceae bacterium]|nr:TolC family protein [Abditibacteriaceae bacterium]